MTILTQKRQATGSKTDTVEAINSDIVALWKGQFGAQGTSVPWPILYPEPTTGGLVVIGCNPALPKKDQHTIPIFKPENGNDRSWVIDQHIAARKEYPYYEPFRRLSEVLKIEWEHIDLFFHRGSTQFQLVKMVTNPNEELNDFGQRQLKLAARLLELTKPRIILVANAFAAKTFKNHFELADMDNEGLYWVEIAGRKVPVFLSSMISYGRLDNHSLERLEWHMRRTIKSLDASQELRACPQNRPR